MSVRMLRVLSCATALAALAGCAANNPRVWEPPALIKRSVVQNRLLELPTPGQKVAVAVYGFTDQTGQFKSSETTQTLSRAVTQGATSILVKSLHDAGNRQWFTVIERERLDNVLRERAVIREMRANYLGEKGINPQALPPLLFAGILLEGGIIGFDSNVKTGGSGARVLGIGGDTKYREDTVTVYLRAVSTKTGEVLTSVSVRKGIQSVALGGSLFRFVSFKELAEIEAGLTYNEPDQLALSQAIEKAVLALIAEGALQDLWCFSSDPAKAAEILTDYIAERDSVDRDKVQLPLRAGGAGLAGVCGTVPRAAAVQAVPAPLAPPVRAAASQASRLAPGQPMPRSGAGAPRPGFSSLEPRQAASGSASTGGSGR